MSLNNHKELTCILSLSVCFLLIFSADFTVLNMQKLLISSIADDQPGFKIEGYTMSGVSYTVFAVSVWFGPYINYVLGSRLTMVLSSFGYLYYVASFITENQFTIFTAAIVCGVAAGTLWPAQGSYMLQNSSAKNTSRNVSIFMTLLMVSNFFGNIFVYFTFQGKSYLDKSTRRKTLYILTTINGVGVAALMFLPKPISRDQRKVNFGPIKTLKNSWKILMSPKMLWLSVAITYAGLQQSFNSGIYGPCIGFTLAFGDSVKELVAFSGMFLSLGALLGSFLSLFLSSWNKNIVSARRLIVLSGIFAQMVAYAIAFINLPDRSVFGNTLQESFIHLNAKLALLGSTLLSFGDFCLSTQIYSFIGEFYRGSSAEACALYKFVKGVSVSLAFYSSSHIGLHAQLIVLIVMAVVGAVGFFTAEQTIVTPLPDTASCKETINTNRHQP